MIALVDSRPQLLNIKQMMQCFIQHRQEVIRRRTNFLLSKAQARAHIVDGLMIAIHYIDNVIRIIRKAMDTKEAREKLILEYNLTVAQTDAILQMRLSSLTGLESNKLQEELDQLNAKISEYQSILADENKILDIIKQETKIKQKYATQKNKNNFTYPRVLY